MSELRSDLAALGRALGQSRSSGPRKMRLATGEAPRGADETGEEG